VDGIEGGHFGRGGSHEAQMLAKTATSEHVAKASTQPVAIATSAGSDYIGHRAR